MQWKLVCYRATSDVWILNHFPISGAFITSLLGTFRPTHAWTHTSIFPFSHKISLSPTPQFLADTYRNKIIFDISTLLVKLADISQRVQKLRGEEYDHVRTQSVGNTAKTISHFVNQPRLSQGYDSLFKCLSLQTRKTQSKAKAESRIYHKEAQMWNVLCFSTMVWVYRQMISCFTLGSRRHGKQLLRAQPPI